MHQIGEIVHAKITKVKPFALFVTLEDGSEGLVHISELSDSFVKDIESFGTVGDELILKVIQIDAKNGFLRLSYKGVPIEKRGHSINANHRHSIESSEDEFAPLKEKLPEWINDVLEKRRNK